MVVMFLLGRRDDLENKRWGQSSKRHSLKFFGFLGKSFGGVVVIVVVVLTD